MSGVKQAFTKDQIDQAIRQCKQQTGEVGSAKSIPPPPPRRRSPGSGSHPACALGRHAFYLSKARRRYPVHLLPAYIKLCEDKILQFLAAVEIRDYPTTLNRLKLALKDYEGLDRLADALAQIEATPHIVTGVTVREHGKQHRRQWIIDQDGRSRRLPR